MLMISKEPKICLRREKVNSMVRKRLQPGSTIGRKVVRPPRPPKGKPRDPMIKIKLAPKPSGPPRTKKRPKPKIKGLGSLMGGAAASVLKTAAGALGKKDLDKLKELFKDQKGNIKPRKFRKPVAKMPPSEFRKRRVGFMKK
jgi:hypothetical protein